MDNTGNTNPENSRAMTEGEKLSEALRRDIARDGIEKREVGTQHGVERRARETQGATGTVALAGLLVTDERADVVRRLAYLPFDESQRGASEQFRNEATDFGFAIVERLPNSRERALALTALEEVLTWVNKAIRGGVR